MFSRHPENGFPNKKSRRDITRSETAMPIAYAVSRTAGSATAEEENCYTINNENKPHARMKRNDRHYINESEETRYVDAAEGLELLEQGYELRGRGIYGSYRFTKVPGSDEVDFWYLDRDEWDSGCWTTEEFLDNMTSIGSVKLLYVSKAPRVRESERPAGNSRRRRKLYESIDYGSLTQRDQLKMDRLVENLRGAKETLESLCYRGDVEDDETRGELLDMHMAVCKMLDRLPW